MVSSRRSHDAHGWPVRRLEQEENETEHVFHALNTFLLVVILAMCILAAYVIKKNRIYFMPESSAAICVGLLVGFFSLGTDAHRFDPEMFFFLLLPPIMFEAGYTLRRKDFFRNIGTISALAVFGTLISTFVVGMLVFWCARAGIVNVDANDPIETLLFGTLISAVDPVATLSIMGSSELNCDPLLYSLVFGESVLNDAVVIVLFRTFIKYYDQDEVIETSQLLLALGDFVGICLGSIFIGVIIGLATSYLFRHTRIRDYPKYEISLLFLFAYGSYALSEAIGLSGIMALFFCGIVLAHYNSYNLSKMSQVTAEETFASLAVVAESFVFMYMGMGLFTGRFKAWDARFVVLVILFCFLGRALNVFPLTALCNLTRLAKVPGRMQVVIWFAGLRGAIAFALSQNMPGPHKGIYETTTLSIVIFTTVVCGGLTEPMLRHMRMKGGAGAATSSDTDDEDQHDRALLGHHDPATPPSNNNNNAQDGPIDGALSSDNGDLAASLRLRRIGTNEIAAGVHAAWRHLDTFYLKPMFGGRQMVDDSYDDSGEAEMSYNNLHYEPSETELSL